MAENNISLKEIANIVNDGKKNSTYDALIDRIERLTEAFEREAQKSNVNQKYLDAIVIERSRLEDVANSQKKVAESLVSELKKYSNNKREFSQDVVNDIMKFRVEWVKIQDKINQVNNQISQEKSGNNNQKEIEQLGKILTNLESQQKELLSGFKGKHGEGTYATKAAESITTDLKKQKEIHDAIEKSESAHVSKTRELAIEQAKYNKEIQRTAENQLLLKRGWNAVWSETKNVASLWLKFNEQAISDAKRLGMTSKAEAMDYTKNLIENAKELSRNFAMTSDQAMKLQESYIKVTGRATFLSKSQMSDIAASSKIMGDETVQGAIKIMDSMGATSQSTVELLDKNYARAKNVGLDINKASEALVQNLSLANKLNFRSGVDGISKMTIYSQRIRMNLQEVANVADKFSTIEGALEGSARLQMLGGTGAMYGSNPMAMMYEAMADPEALFKRMGKMFSTQAYFDKRTGEARIDPVQMAIMREQAKAMGMNPDEAIQSAKQQAKLRSIESDLRAANPSLFNSMTEDQRAAIGNKAEYSKESGWTVTYYDSDKNKQVTSAVDRLTASQLEKITKDNKEPIDDIRDRVREIAGELVGTKERYNSMFDQLKMSSALFLHKPMGVADATMTGINGTPAWGYLTGGGLLGGGGSLLTSALIGSIQTYGMWRVGKALWKGGGRLLGGGSSSAASKASGGSRGFFGFPSRKNRITATREKHNLVRDVRTGRLDPNSIEMAKETRATSKAAKTARGLKNLRALKSGGGALAVGTELLFAGIDYHNAETKKDKWGAVGQGTGAAIGAAIGSVVGGPVGLAIGAMAGGQLGNWIGKGIAPKEEKDYKGDIGEYLKDIKKDNAKENIRKIVLPVESIDYNVALIAKSLGVSSAMPANGNIYLESAIANGDNVEVQELNASRVNQQDSNVVYNSQYQPRGPLTLNINGSIDLNMKGTNIGNLSAADFKKMFESNPELQRWITEAITNRQVRNGNAARNNQENSNNRIGTTSNSYKLGG